MADRPLWEAMAAAYSRAIAGKTNTGLAEGYAAELRALADEVEARVVPRQGFHPDAPTLWEVHDWLRAEACRAEAGEAE